MTSEPERKIPFAMLQKTSGRVAAVQFLYQLAVNPSEMPVPQQLTDFLAQYEGSAQARSEAGKRRDVPPDIKTMRNLVQDVLDKKSEIDDVLTPHLARGDSLSALSPLMAAVLRGGGAELLRGKLAPGVIISEFMKVAEAFYGPDETAFVNAILDAAAKSLPARGE